MKSHKLTTKTSRAAALFALLFIGIFLQCPGVAFAQTSVDLALSAINTPIDVYTNDYMPYTMFVTNLGPGTVANVIVSNTLPSGFTFINATPAYTLTGNTLVFNLGSLTNLATEKILVSVKPASAGNYTVSASINSTNNTDPNSANNSSSFNFGVGNYFPGNLSASLISTQVADIQTGLEAQFIQISNNTASTIPSARVVVTGVSKQLFEAAGTNNGSPFVIYGSPLAPGQVGTLLLEFAPRGTFTIANSQLNAFATPLARLAPPSNLGMAVAILQDVREGSGALYGGNVVFWPGSWPINTNLSYTVVYSDNSQFSNPLMSPQIVQPYASTVQWVDYGPPATISVPTNTTPRYYRAYLNP